MGALSFLRGTLSRDLGLKTDAASATGSAHAKLAALRVQPSTFQADGVHTSPVADAVLTDGVNPADTGPLAVGEYEVIARVHITIEATTQSSATIEHRDSTNANTLRYTTLATNRGTGNNGTTIIWRRYTIAANERIRLINRGVNGVTGGAQGDGWWGFSLAVRPV